jgi:hypothetical protein
MVLDRHALDLNHRGSGMLSPVRGASRLSETSPADNKSPVAFDRHGLLRVRDAGRNYTGFGLVGFSATEPQEGGVP